jgi:hypothetical protein
MKSDFKPEGTCRRMLGGLKVRPPWPVMLLLLLGGCAGVEIGSALQVAQYGTTVFTRGSMETVVAQPFDQVVTAVRTTIDELDLQIAVDRPQDKFLYLKTVDEQRTSIIFRIQEKTHAVTAITVKVGYWGDEPYSTAIMARVNEVYKRLYGERPIKPVVPLMPPPSAPPPPASMNTSTPSPG